MIEERVLERGTLVPDRRSRERYFEDGFLTVPGYVGAWLDRLRSGAAKVEESRAGQKVPRPRIRPTRRGQP